MKKYCEYKDSHIGWIGDIPGHWKLKTLHHYLKMVSVKGYPDEQLLSVVREQGVIVRNTESQEENHNFIPDDLSGYKLVKKGQFAINKMKSWQGSYGVSQYQGIVSPAYYVCDLNFDNKRFFNEAIRSQVYIPFFTQYSKGIRVGQWDLSPIGLKSIPFIEPPVAEQQHIVSFLDEKTAKIDEYIDKKNKEIEALKEWKKALIAHVVTKGLNTNAKMKDSGVSWIGEIPEHWKVDKLGMHFRQRNEKVSDKEFPALSVSKEGVTPQLSTAVKTDNGDNRKKVCKGDFVVNSRSDRKGSCGFSSYDGSVSLINIVVTPIDLCDRYYHYLFRSNNYIEEFYRLGRGIVADLWTTRYVEMRNIMIPLPPIEEQQEIVEYIDAATTKADKMIVELTNHVESMKEYRQRLIADVVTGKINVQPCNPFMNNAYVNEQGS